jgi:uncharacterized phage protein (TIGR02216 family)
MSGFAQQARRLCGQAGLLLGWRPEDFWRATPDELADALMALHDLVGAPATPLARTTLNQLMERHPDG